MEDYPDRLEMFIDGAWTGGGGRDMQPVLDPATGNPIGALPMATAADLDLALAAADKGFRSWRATAPAVRGAILRRAAALLRERASALSAIVTREQGKPLAEARGEIARAADILDWDAAEGQRAYGRVVPGLDGIQQSVLRKPIGPVAAFSTWNVPVVSPARKISGALAAGCSIVIKASEETPASAIALVRCFDDAGLPPGVLNLVFGVPEAVSRQLIASPAIRLVTLTGPIAVGKHLARLCADQMKPSTMELGGHSPVIVCEDADAAAAARLTASSRYRNAGQICTAPTRFFVHESRYQTFLDTFVACARSLRVGNGSDEGVEMGPLANERRLTAMERLVADARSHGARVVTGGRRIGDRGNFFEPTVLTDLPETAEVMRMEPFGPLALIMPYHDLDDAVERANSLPYGLAAYAFTGSTAMLSRLVSGLESGSLSVNHMNGIGLPELPLGGVKESGYGHEGGAESLQAYFTTMVVSQA